MTLGIGITGGRDDEQESRFLKMEHAVGSSDIATRLSNFDIRMELADEKLQYEITGLISRMDRLEGVVIELNRVRRLGWLSKLIGRYRK